MDIPEPHRADKQVVASPDTMAKPPLPIYGYTAADTPVYEPLFPPEPRAMSAHQGLAPIGVACKAAASAHIYICPQWGQSCDPNQLQVGDEVPLQVCIEANGEIIAGDTGFVEGSDGIIVDGEAVSMDLSPTEITIYLTAKDSVGAQLYDDVLEYVDFIHLPDVNTTFEIATSHSCQSVA